MSCSWTYGGLCDGAACILLKGGNGEAYNIANEESNEASEIRQKTVADSSAGERWSLIFPMMPVEGNTTPITKAVFATDKLEALG